MMIHSSPTRVRATITGSAAAWIQAVTDQATLMTLLGTLHALDGTSSSFRRSGPQIATGAHLAQPAPPTQALAVPTDPTAAMRAELEQLRASVATMTTELKSRSQASGQSRFQCICGPVPFTLLGAAAQVRHRP